MSSRNNRDRLSRYVELEFRQTGLINMREVFLYLFRLEVLEIKKNKIIPPFLQFGINGVGDNIPWSQGLPFVISLHELFAITRAKDPAETAYCLRYQETRAARIEQCRGMKLNKFHVGDFCSRPIRHCHTIARRNRWIRGMQVDLTETAGGEHHHFCRERIHGVHNGIESIRSPAMNICAVDNALLLCRVFCQQVNRNVVLKHRDRGLVGDRLNQRPFNFPPCKIMGMHYAVCRVPPLPPEIKRFVTSGELNPDLNQFMEPIGPLLHHDLYCVFV